MRTLRIILGLFIVQCLSSAVAQTWPQRPITFIVSQAAGASPDVMARLVADRVSKILGQTVLIDNKPGGGNVVGATAAARSAPDGYTFFFATSAALATNPFMVKNMNYDPVKDFAPVALVTRSHQLFVVNPDVPAKTLAELIALDKASPGKYSISVDGARNLAGVTAQALNKRAGTKFELIPSSNINNGLQDTVAGRTQAGVFSTSIAEGLVRSGALRAIAVASNKRLEAAPNVPAAAETLPGFDFSGWFMLVAPTGTPSDIIKKLNAAVDEATRDAQIKDMAPKLGFELNSASVGSPEQAADFLKAQLSLWEQTTKDLGIELQ